MFPLRAILAQTMSPTVIKGSIEEISEEFRRRFEKIAKSSIAARGFFSVGVTGGSVAERLLPALRSAQVNWRKTQVFFGDERAVPPSSLDSNERLVREKLFDHVGIPPEQIHRMKADEADLHSAARAYEELLTETLGIPPKLDLMTLGVGEDGHVCSLFPGDPALDATDQWVIAVTRSPKPPARRLSLSIPALTSARHIFIGGFGRAKSDVILRALEEPPSTLPISRVIHAAANVTLLIAG